MNALENKPILQAAFAELATSYAKPFVDLMTDDFCWVCTGTTLWSRRYAGKQAVPGELFAPLRAKLGRIPNQRLIDAKRRQRADHKNHSLHRHIDCVVGFG